MQKSAPPLGPDFVSSPTIRYFVAVAEAGSFRGAAEQIGIAASAIHRQIGLLEKQLQVELLIRGRRSDGVRLTSAGELLLYRVRLAMHQVNLGLQEIEGVKGTAFGKVSVVTTDTLAQDVFALFLPDFNRRHPNIQIELQVLERRRLIETLEENRVDIGLCYDLPVRLTFHAFAEFELNSTVVVPVGHPLAERSFATLGECAQYPLAFPIEGENLQGILNRMQLVSQIRPRIALSVNSFVVMREVVAAGMGISIHTRLRGKFARRDPRIVYVPLKDSLVRYSTLTCSSPADRQLGPEARLFVSELLDELQRELGPPSAGERPAAGTGADGPGEGGIG